MAEPCGAYTCSSLQKARKGGNGSGARERKTALSWSVETGEGNNALRPRIGGPASAARPLPRQAAHRTAWPSKLAPGGVLYVVCSM